MRAKVVNYFMPCKFSFEFSHYDTSCFIERNGKFVYISHSSTLARMDSGVRIELDSFLIRTAQDAKDYRGGYNQYCNMENLQSMIDTLLEEWTRKKMRNRFCSASFLSILTGAYRRRILPLVALPDTLPVRSASRSRLAGWHQARHCGRKENGAAQQDRHS